MSVSSVSNEVQESWFDLNENRLPVNCEQFKAGLEALANLEVSWVGRHELTQSAWKKISSLDKDKLDTEIQRVYQVVFEKWIEVSLGQDVAYLRKSDLAKLSKMFAALAREKWEESETGKFNLKLAEGVSAEAGHQFFAYLQTGEISEWGEVFDIYRQASLYQVTPLLAESRRCIGQSLTKEILLDTLKFAREFHDLDLERICFDFVLQHQIQFEPGSVDKLDSADQKFLTIASRLIQTNRGHRCEELSEELLLDTLEFVCKFADKKLLLTCFGFALLNQIQLDPNVLRKQDKVIRTILALAARFVQKKMKLSVSDTWGAVVICRGAGYDVHDLPGNLDYDLLGQLDDLFKIGMLDLRAVHFFSHFWTGMEKLSRSIPNLEELVVNGREFPENSGVCNEQELNKLRALFPNLKGYGSNGEAAVSDDGSLVSIDGGSQLLVSGRGFELFASSKSDHEESGKLFLRTLNLYLGSGYDIFNSFDSYSYEQLKPFSDYLPFLYSVGFITRQRHQLRPILPFGIPEGKYEGAQELKFDCAHFVFIKGATEITRLCLPQAISVHCSTLPDLKSLSAPMADVVGLRHCPKIDTISVPKTASCTASTCPSLVGGKDGIPIKTLSERVWEVAIRVFRLNGPMSPLFVTLSVIAIASIIVLASYAGTHLLVRTVTSRFFPAS